MKISNLRRKHGMRLRPIRVTVQVDSLVRGYLRIILNYYKLFCVMDVPVRVNGSSSKELVLERCLYFPIVKLTKKEVRNGLRPSD